MKKQTLIRFAVGLIASLAGFLVISGGQAFAATKTWVGTDCPATNCNWSNVNNWSGGVVPVNGDDVVINMSAATPTSGNQTTNDIGALTLASITTSGYTATSSSSMGINSNAGLLTITGNVTHNAPSVAAPTGYAPANELVIDGNVTLGGTSIFTNASMSNTRTLTLGGNTLTILTTSLYSAGNSTFGFDQLITGSGTVNVAVATNLALFLHAANTYSGTTNVQTVDYITTLGGGTGMFGTSTVNLGASGRILFEGNGSVTISNPINVTPPAVTGTFLSNQLEFWSQSSAVTFTVPAITLLGNARFGTNTIAGGVTVNLAGITTNGHCIQYGDNNSDVANFQNGPSACSVAVSNSPAAAPKTPNTGVMLLKSNPIVVGAFTLMTAAGLVVVARRLKATS